MALVVFTGGARSGKSAAAQNLAQQRACDGTPVTIVVFGRPGVDEEFDARVAKHRADRPRGWDTVEIGSCVGIEEGFGLRADGLLVVDCLGTLVGLCMEHVYDELAPGGLGGADAATLPADFESRVTDLADSVVAWLGSRPGDTIAITNEVGAGVVPAYATGRVFQDVLGRVNRALVDRADRAYLCVAGRLLELSGAPRTPRWPED